MKDKFVEKVEDLIKACEEELEWHDPYYDMPITLIKIDECVRVLKEMLHSQKEEV